MSEVWAPVPDDWRYQVSNRGRVRSYRRGPPILMTPERHQRRGHLRLRIDGVTRTVHSLVLEAFVGPRPEGAIARHLNDIPDDNRVENLAWGTLRENYFDAVRNGRRMGVRGTKNGQARISEDAVKAIMRSREPSSATAPRYGISRSAVKLIRAGVTWKHVPRDPDDVAYWKLQGGKYR